MDISFMELLILALASFRLTRLLLYDKITEFMRNPFFDEIQETNEKGETEVYLIPKKGGIRGFLGKLLSCHWCTGIWSSLLLSILYLLTPFIINPVLLVLAVAGLAAIGETLIQHFIKE
ncbi:DUF1360 domain-containing protein [Bacillus sp. FJAT-29790]|uniref:DUF1360 domain-containing protein n=1 Tax=Bacillus sp. FJAT-29790 TaxID=1895002 RepID=UPI001C232ED3|nr:DUF1360 domain-containing protein [Bacillus sp. FJAT-29790]MBU8877489.1 DUF1360 domain-containing protein [Bacillus sp. FJAT-29790]